MSAIQQLLVSYVPAAAAAAYYYSPPGTGSYNSSTTVGPTNACGMRITAGQSGTIDSIGFRCNTFNLTRTVKIALYSNAANPVLLADGGTATITHNGIAWADRTISYAATVGTVYQVWVVAVNTDPIFSAQSSAQYFDSNSTLVYAAFPAGTISTVRNIPSGTAPAVRLHITP